MGFLRSLNQLTRQAKEIQAAAPPMDQRLAHAMASMQQASALMSQQTMAARSAASPASVAGEARVLAARDTGLLVDFVPVLELDLLVSVAGQPPYPVSIRAAVAHAHLGQAGTGGMLEVRVDPAHPEAVHLVW
jgi:hypothetical protein